MSVSNQYDDIVLELPPLFTILHTSTVFVMALHCFAIYVIFEHSPSQMKAYSRYLLAYEIVTTATDLIVMWLIAPQFSFPVLGLIPTGPLSALGVSTATQATFGVASFFFTSLSITELFFQRHQAIVPYDSCLKLKRRKIYIWHIVLVVFAAAAIGCASVIMMFNECDREQAEENFPSLKQLIFHKNFFCLGGIGHLLNFVLHVVEAVTTTIDAFLIVSSIYHLNNYKMSSKKTRDMQKKLFKVLIIQVAAPLVFIVVPCLLVGYITISRDVVLVDINPWILFMFCLHGPSSTFLILVLYAPYYQYVKSLCFGKMTKTSKTSNRTSIATVGYSRTSIHGVNVVGNSNIHRKT